ncbi:hypothetical protein ACWGH2_36975 [Streptomyces sp. NPDC054871]
MLAREGKCELSEKVVEPVAARGYFLLEAPSTVADQGRLLVRVREEYTTALASWVMGDALTRETSDMGQKARDCLGDFIRVASETLKC